LNIQTERLENNIARLTVEVEPERLEKAKHTAARKIAGQVNIPGFRKGKAPYRILANYVGEAAILEEAIETLGNEIYKEALDQGGVDPYGPGALEDFKLDPAPVFQFTVPLQPTAELNDYRAVRVEYTAPTVEDKEVDQMMRRLQEGQAVVEESQRPVEAGNRVTLDIHSHFVNDDHSHDEDENKAEGEQDPHDAHNHDESYIHEHDMVVSLYEGDDEPVAPGFTQALVGANVGDNREFTLTLPDDEEYGEAKGRKVHFHVNVKKVEIATLPEWSDDLAARITADEEKPLTMLELRLKTREDLQKSAERRAKNEHAREALDKIVEQAHVEYPEMLVEDQITSMIEDLDRNLRQQGITYKDFLRITQKNERDVRDEYREPAINLVKRTLVLREIVRQEQIEVSEERVNQEVDEMVSRFGGQAEQFRSLFDTPAVRDNIKNDLLQQTVMDRIGALARGETITNETPSSETASE
jgi:trigger factor